MFGAYDRHALTWELFFLLVVSRRLCKRVCSHSSGGAPSLSLLCTEAACKALQYVYLVLPDDDDDDAATEEGRNVLLLLLLLKEEPAAAATAPASVAPSACKRLRVACLLYSATRRCLKYVTWRKREGSR